MHLFINLFLIFLSVIKFQCCVGTNSRNYESEFTSYQIDNPPRVVTNLEIIYGSYGVRLDYSYNETTLRNDTHFGSVPGCPKSIDGFPWVYYGNPPRCYLAGHHGPCPFAQKLFLQNGSPYGVCACECLEDRDYGEELNRPEIRYVFCRKLGLLDAPQFGQIYDKQAKQCYNHFEMGPCKPGTVIADYSSTSLQCLPICDESKTDWFLDRNNGLCATNPVLPVTGTREILTSGHCLAGERYSEALRKCVRSTGSISVG